MFAILALSGCLLDKDGYLKRKAELTDGDGDGFAQEDDCDDTEPSVSPSATEVCDGVDQDCDGAIDDNAVDSIVWYPDGDGDGHGVPTAAVVACDAPGSGYSPVSDDCDDANAGAYPGAAEFAYDGVDQDCDGADLDDLDGDGWTSEITGGADCDDSNPSVNPEAEEVWTNGVTDNDCDGELEAIQLDYGADAWAGWRADEALGRTIAALGDLDGDGLADVAIGSPFDSTVGASSGALYRVSGSPSGSLEGAAALLPVDVGQAFGWAMDAGADVSGDGVGDLLVVAPGTPTTKGEAWLVDGNAWALAGSTTVDTVALGTVTATTVGTFGPGDAGFLGDVTGDGVDDIALGECCSEGSAPGSFGRVAIFSVDAFDGTFETADVTIDGPFAGAYFGQRVDRLDDQDGDGLADLLVSSGGGVIGAVVAGTSSGNVLDLAITLLYGEVEGVRPVSVLDVDGDGRDDVAVVEQDNIAAFFTALGSTPTRNLESPTFSFTWSGQSGVYDIIALGDLDEDGRSETLIPQAWSDSGDQRLWILMGQDVLADGTMDAESVYLKGVSSVPAALFGYTGVLAGDVDGDGQKDVVLGAPEYSAGAHYAGGATLITVPE